MRTPRPAACARWFAESFDRGAVVLGASGIDVPTDGDLEIREMQPLTVLRWISRPRGIGARLLALENGGSAALLLHVGADALTGDVTLVALGDDDPPPVDQLSALGVAADATDEGAAVATQDALAAVLRFAVVTTSEAPSRPDEDRPPVPEHDDLPLDITDSAFIGLATDSGAPLEGIWHTMWQLSGVRWCLINVDVDDEEVARIPYRQSLRADDFVRALRVCVDAGLRYLDLPVYVTTGDGAGHAIHLEAFDGDDVVYHDPWPGRSLLAAGNNTTGVAARPIPESRRWRITTAELARVGCASLVEPSVWASICGVSADVALADVLASDLVGFFHFGETGRRPDGEHHLTHIALKPGHWQEHVDLVLSVDEDEVVSSAQLIVDRAWIDDLATAPFAFDLIASCLRAAVPEADADDAEQLVRALAAVPAGGLQEALAAGSPHLLDQFRTIALAVVGAVPVGRALLPCSTLRAYNVIDDEQRKLAIVVTRPRHEPGPLAEDQMTGYFMDAARAYLWRKTQRELERLGFTKPAPAEPAGA